MENKSRRIGAIVLILGGGLVLVNHVMKVMEGNDRIGNYIIIGSTILLISIGIFSLIKPDSKNKSNN